MKTTAFFSLSFICVSLMHTSPLFAAEPLSPHDKAAAQKVVPSGKVKNIGVNEFESKAADKSTVILDVRTPKEYRSGHLPGAVNVDFNAPDFDQKIAKLDKDKTYLVHCAVGGRSAKACEKMSALPFKDVYNLEGGIKAWEKAGKKVVK
jgi:rhodanese-related sulfurtransferase